MTYRIMTVTGSVIALHAGSEHSGNVPQNRKITPSLSLAQFSIPVSSTGADGQVSKTCYHLAIKLETVHEQKSDRIPAFRYCFRTG
jgi:hypothetical protein